ncbi:MAG: hypothetical protein KVP17_002590 [Porospora cf. gigantea B]|uniref:uncharacterized protein n=1 Tax=Porospora cf. gigantea B TaxID=2853592 RepID=UPI003571F1D7|nr:MAG: hypothetical protein KVP17_002590 [Porospora cf. gigantea B]
MLPHEPAEFWFATVPVRVPRNREDDASNFLTFNLTPPSHGLFSCSPQSLDLLIPENERADPVSDPPPTPQRLRRSPRLKRGPAPKRPRLSNASTCCAESESELFDWDVSSEPDIILPLVSLFCVTPPSPAQYKHLCWPAVTVSEEENGLFPIHLPPCLEPDMVDLHSILSTVSQFKTLC